MWLAFLGLSAGLCFVFWTAFSFLTPSRPAHLEPLPKAEELGIVLPPEPAAPMRFPQPSEQEGRAGARPFPGQAAGAAKNKQEETAADLSLYPTPEEERHMEEEGLIAS